MGRFLKSEKVRQTASKHKFFSIAAQDSGDFRKKPRTFCLPVQSAEENLYYGIRNAAMNYFKDARIKWHQGHNDKPSNHLCDSQVSCVNFLYPFTDNPEALKTLLLPVFPDISAMLKVENDHYVAFEWIGQQDYLIEARGRKRTRGANATSSDAFILFETQAGTRHAVLIEWKYTESYSRTSLATSKNGTNRALIYKSFFDKPCCRVNRNYGTYTDFFYEPFYQLLRQQLLAQEMEQVKEFNADVVSVLHIAPRANRDFNKVTSLNLAACGDSPTAIWSKIVIGKRFNSVYTEDLFVPFDISKHPELQGWWEYITERYRW